MYSRARFVAILLVAVMPWSLMRLGSTLDPIAIDIAQRHVAPSLGAVFGTDALGRDMFARTTYAAGLSLGVALKSLAVSFALALTLGGSAGLFARRWPDHIISWVASLLFTLPFILILVSLFTIVPPNLSRTYIAIGFIAWAAPARIVRSEVVRLRREPFVVAQRAMGWPRGRVLLLTIVPLLLRPAFLSLLLFLPELIGIEVGLSFFGLGASPPTPTLGRLIYDGMLEFETAWWLAIAPAAMLALLVTSVMSIASDWDRSRDRRAVT